MATPRNRKTQTPEEAAEQIKPPAAKPRTGARTRKKPAAKKPATRGKKVGGRQSTVAEILTRGRQIVIDHDVYCMTWVGIAQKHGIDEKTARTDYKRHIEEIAPVLENDVPMEVGRKFIRRLQGIQQAVGSLAHEGNPKPEFKLRALEALAALLDREITFRQHLGMLPKELGQIRVIEYQQWVVDQIMELIDELGASAEHFEKLAQIVHGDPAGV